MYRDLKAHFWWHGMKWDIGRYVAQYLTCRQVKVEYRVPAVKLQILPILEWKWDQIIMDFVMELPRA